MNWEGLLDYCPVSQDGIEKLTEEKSGGANILKQIYLHKPTAAGIRM